MLQVERALDVGDLLVDAGAVDSELREDGPRLVDAAPGHEPSGALGRGEQEEEERRRGDDLDPQHPPPFRGPEIHAGDQVVRQERDEDAQHDVELLGRHETAAEPRRGDLGDVQGRDHRRTADGQSAQEPEGEERVPIPRQGAAQRRHEIEDGQRHERLLPAPDVGGLSREDRTDDRADEGDGDGEAQGRVIQSIRGPEGLGRARDHGRVEAEEQPAERRHDRAADQGRGERDRGRRGCCRVARRSKVLRDHDRTSEGVPEGNFKASGKVGVPPGLGADERRDIIRVAVDLVEGPTGQTPDDQGRGEGVTRPDRVAHRDGQTRMVGPLAVGQQQAPVRPSREGDQREPEARGQLSHRLTHVGREAEHRRQRGQLLIVELEGVRQRQRVGDDVAIDERGSKVHVEQAQGPGAAGRDELADRGARRLVPLREAPEADRVRTGGPGERRLVGLDPVPGDVLADRESGLAVGGQGNVDRPRGGPGVDLDGLGGEAQGPESLQDLVPQGIVADPRDQPRVGTQRTALIREIGRCAPELLAGRQQVPEHFAHGEDLMSHDRNDRALTPPVEDDGKAPRRPGRGTVPVRESASLRRTPRRA